MPVLTGAFSDPVSASRFGVQLAPRKQKTRKTGQTPRSRHSIIYEGDRMLFFYDATDKPRGEWPHYCISVAQLPRDRFQALRPRKLHRDGVIETKPLDFVEDGDLKLNADATNGRIEVELCDYDGQSIEGFTRTDCNAIEATDGLDLPVRWGDQSIAQAVGKAWARPRHIRVRFYLKQASLFAADFPKEHPWPVPRDYAASQV